MNYTAFQTTATKMIASFGTTCKVLTVDGDSFQAKVVFLPAEKKDSPDGNYVVSYDKVAYINNCKSQPKPGDQVVVGKEVLVVVTSVNFIPDMKTNLYYKLELKS